MQARPVFAKKFMWGASISAHQVEGGQHNQWTIWEQENAASLAARAPYHYGELANWPDIKRLATTPANYVSGRAVDHYRRYSEDFEMASKLGMNSLRVSIEWSRIEPEAGVWNAEAVEHYRQYFASIKQHGLAPVVTLFHFTLPVWFSELGGFSRRSNVQYFTRFVEKILDEYGEHLRYIITINEPTIYASESYLTGHWPPNIQSKRSFMAVLNNLIVAHNRSAKLIRARSRKYQVSIAYHVSHIYAGDDSYLSEATAKQLSYWRNHYVIKRTVKTSTFIGLNYYGSDRVYGYRVHNPNDRTSDMGWDLQPGDIRYVLEDLADRYDKPVLITENGLADADDSQRAWWLTSTVTGIHQAVKGGVSVLGYLHWSLLDTIEWDKGRWPRFGLIEVDYRTMKRTPRESAAVYRRMIKKLTKEK